MATTPQTVILPAPPRPQQEFSYEYSNQLYRWLDNFARQFTGFPYLRGSGLYLPGLPTSGYGLKPGEVFSNAGVLTIVREDDIWVGTLSATAAVGTVTVTP